MLKYKRTVPNSGIYEGKQLTNFDLKAGSKLKMGDLDVILADDTEFFVEGSFPYDAVVEHIFLAGNAGANVKHWAFVDTKEDGTKVDVTYDESAGRIETAIVAKEAVVKTKPETPVKKEEPAPTSVHVGDISPPLGHSFDDRAIAAKAKADADAKARDVAAKSTMFTRDPKHPGQPLK